MELCQAGVKAYNRWLFDEFGSESDRLFLIGIIGSAPWRDVDEMIVELDWLADNGFKATSVPGFTAYPGQPPLFDKYWDPFWARCQEHDITLWMHAGQGEGQGELGAIFQRIGGQVDDAQGDVGKAIDRLRNEFFKGKDLLQHQAAPRDVADDDGRGVRPLSQTAPHAQRDLR